MTCKRTNHKTEDCRLKGKPKCSYCNRFFHVKEDCRKFSYDKRKARVQFIKKGKAKMVTQAIAEEQPKANISEIADINDANTVGLESVAMFGSFGLVAVWCFTVWKSYLALQRESKVLLLGFLMEFSSYDLNQWLWRYALFKMEISLQHFLSF